jgi:hypothetical protein
VFALAALALTGCQPQSAPPRPAPAAADTASDLCSQEVDGLCERFLLYYAAHQDLPQDLAELTRVESGRFVGLTCPVSGKPYVYNRQGVLVGDWPGRLILYDAEPTHAGMRFGILIELPAAGRTVVFRPVRLPEAALAAALKATQPRP